jgi:hypothetical protein
MCSYRWSLDKSQAFIKIRGIKSMAYIDLFDGFNKFLDASACTPQIDIRQFNGVQLISEDNCSLDLSRATSGMDFVTGSTVWRWVTSLSQVNGCEGAYNLSIRFTLVQGQASETTLGLRLVFKDWSVDHYVLMPAAVYNGNRFESRAIPYPPILEDPADIGPHVPTIISDVPRLNNRTGPSRIQQLTHDLATPAIGFHSPLSARGFWLLTEQATRLGDSGIDIEESNDRRQAVVTVSVPGVRQNERYTIANMHHPCEDRGADFTPGDTITLLCQLYFFPCARIQDLFDIFVDIRKDLAGKSGLTHQIPFSSAWQIQEDKYNRENWEEQLGFYSAGIRDDFIYSHWQVGWVGGLMAAYPMLANGSDLSRERALRNFDFVFPDGQDRSGFLHGCGKDGQWFGDNFRDTSMKWLLIRKNSDALYFLIKQFMLLKKQDPQAEIPARYLAGTQRLADAFVRLWDRYGQFGQFIDTQTGAIIVGGSVSAGIAPAGLALAGQFFGNPDYLRVAQASAENFYTQFVQKGFTTGGPGEILQCPDSESAFGLLESFIVLFEVTGMIQWLDHAKDQANQCFTWCVSYDFKFPPESTFGRMNMRTTGSVYANVQNKHSAPGICTLSGDSLFKLFRATGNLRYLDLIREMAHNLPQYLSRSDRPVSGMPAGWMCERVEMSDWLEPVGEIFFGSCWCEVSNMLVYTELPGLYVQIDTGLVCSFDHIDAVLLQSTPEAVVLQLTNPTLFPARLKVLAETSLETRIPLGQNALWGCRQVDIQPGQTIILSMPKSSQANP